MRVVQCLEQVLAAIAVNKEGTGIADQLCLLDDAHKEQILKQKTGRATPEITRFKGLGEISPREFKQFIGDDSDRSLQIQEVVEACSKQLNSRVLIVATGQSALSGTPQLQKLRDRFRVPIQLSDTDVEAVIRKLDLERVKQVRVIIKADTQGSLQVLKKEIGGEAAFAERRASLVRFGKAQAAEQAIESDPAVLDFLRDRLAALQPG